MPKLPLAYVINLILPGAIFFSLLISFPAFAQRCPVPQLLEARAKDHPQFTDKFEDWMQQKISSRKEADFSLSRSSAQKLLVQVPVVFHIIHKGEEVGTGSNLSKERIDRQLAILNEDFNRLNSDTTETLAQFKALASAIEIEFIYAKQDPDELETTGIVRLLGSQSSYSYQNRSLLSSESYWPAEDFLNIWVADLSGNSIGWAEFPVSSLPGLEEASDNRLIDGVTIDYQYFGENPSSPSFESFGRTTTHEMGHFFGLRHIWGDGGCSVDDFCEDTPASGESSTGCDLTKNTCGSLDMVQNFMDYTNDVCMNLFTEDQKSRIRTVLENSPRRASLTTSLGLQEPIVYDYDLALYGVNDLYSSSCTTSFTPKVQVKNTGLLAAQNFELHFFMDNILLESAVINSELLPGKVMEIEFNTIDFVNSGQYDITYEAQTEAGQPDGRPENNTLTEYAQLLPQGQLPYSKSFRSGFANWQIRNNDQEESWMILNNYAGIPLFDNKRNIGQEEQLISPVFDFTDIEHPEMSFVFSQSADTLPHKLLIYASFDCGETFNDLIYSSVDDKLITAYAVDSAFVPQYGLDWDTAKIDLSSLVGNPSVCFNLVLENRNANNFYLSDFFIQNSPTPEKEVTPSRWLDANPLYCNETIDAELEVINTGRSFVNSFLLEVIDEGSVIYATEFNEGLAVGAHTNIRLPAINPASRNGKVQVVTSVINEEALLSKRLSLPYQQNCDEELPPLRLSLKNGDQANWYTFNPNTDVTWQYDETLNVVSSNSAIIQEINQEDWLISPLLDVSNVRHLGLIFDIAYQKPFMQSESFQIVLSDVNGETFNTIIYDKGGDSLATAYGNNEQAKPVWRNEFLDLSPFVYREKIRLAFKANHDNGQNILLNNISFFVGKNPPPAFPATTKPLVVYPNPASSTINLHLNLAGATTGFFQITDLQGKVILEFNEPKVLNQFIVFDISSLADGMYLLHLNTPKFRKTTKFIVRKNSY